MSFARPAPASVYLLADHLDAALAAGEDIVAHGRAWALTAERPLANETGDCERRSVLENVRTYELALIARILTARSLAQDVAANDERFKLVAQLFVSATAILVDAVAECSDSTDADFNTADSLLGYVRSRGLVASDAARIPSAAILKVDDEFLIARRLPLGALLDMAAAFLDSLEVQYDLFADDAADGTSAKPLGQEIPSAASSMEDLIRAVRS